MIKIMYSAEAVNELLLCPVCLEQYTSPKTLPCHHVLCYSCVHGLSQGATTVQCPVCRKTHTIPAGGVAAFDNSFFINSLLGLPKETPPCNDCQASEGITVCQHCQTKVCVDCRVEHAEKTAAIRECEKHLHATVSSRDALTIVKEKMEHWSTSVRELKAGANRMMINVDEIFESLAKRKTMIQDTVDLLVKIEDGLYQVSAENADPSVIYKHLTDQVNDSTTTQALTDLKDKLSMTKTAVQSLLSSDDQFQVVWDENFLDAAKNFGGIEFGGKTFNIDGEGTTANCQANTECERKHANIRQNVGPDVTSQDASTNTDTVHPPLCSVQTQYEQEEEEVGLADQEGECSASSLATSSTVVVVPAVTKVKYCQNELPCNVNYEQKQRGWRTIIGRSSDTTCRLNEPFGAVYSVQDDVIYVADNGNDRVMVYDVNGENGRVFYTVTDPTDVTMSDSHVLVLTRKAVHRLNRTGELISRIRSFQRGALRECIAIEFRNDHIVVLDTHHKSIIFYDSVGDYKRHFRPFTNLNNPQDLAIDNQGMIYITDRGNDSSARVNMFGWNGKFHGRFAEAEGDGEDDIAGVCVDGDGFVSVTRTDSNRIDVYGPDRQRVCSYGRPGKRPGCLSGPLQVKMMPDGRAIVVDTDNNRVQLF